jgi:hypothetical protein
MKIQLHRILSVAAKALGIITILVAFSLVARDRLPSVTPAPADAEMRGAPERIEWLALGPFAGSEEGAFPDPIDRDWLETGGGEARARPLGVQRLDAKAWLPLPSSAERVYVSALGGEEKGVFYAYRRLAGGPGGRALLVVDAGRPLKVWVEGSLVYARYANSRCLEEVEVELPSGPLSLLVKVEGQARDCDFSLSFSPPSSEPPALRGPLRTRLLSRLVDLGGALRGFLPSVPGLSGQGPVVLGVWDAKGALVLRGEARAGLPFAFDLPAGFAGLLKVGPLGAGAEPAYAFVGDARGEARRAAAAAREAGSAYASGAPKPGGGGWDPAATFSFLAGVLEGGAGSGTEEVLDALGEIDSLLYLRGAPPGPGRRWRLAYRSALDGSLRPYGLELPEPAPGAKPALLIALPDAGESDLFAMRRVEGGAKTGVVVLALSPRGEASFTGLGEEELETAFDLAAAFSHYDRTRVWLLGWGRGASSALRYTLLRPGRLAALALFGGRVPTEELEPLLGLPLLSVVARDDETIGTDERRIASTRLETAGALLEAAETGGLGPGEAWEAWTGDDPLKILAWLRSRVATSLPARVELRAPSPRYGEAPRLRLLETIDPAQAGALSFEFLDQRHLSLVTQNVRSFELDLSGRDFARGGRIIGVIDGRSYTLDAGKKALLELSQEGGGFSAVSDEGGGRERAPAPHEGGGLMDLYRSPLLIVYGTRRPGRTQTLRALAASLAGKPAEGIGVLGPAGGLYEIIADSAATAAAVDGRALLLLGGPEDNALSARLLPSLPASLARGLALPRGAAGLVLVYPNPELPGRLFGMVATELGTEAAMKALSRALAALRPGFPPGREDYRSPDLLVFDRGGGTVSASSFDRDWKELRSWGP